LSQNISLGNGPVVAWPQDAMRGVAGGPFAGALAIGQRKEGLMKVTERLPLNN
jgi:hypothetical protein